MISFSTFCYFYRKFVHFFSTLSLLLPFFFFLNDPATTEIYPLPLHDALPISGAVPAHRGPLPGSRAPGRHSGRRAPRSPTGVDLARDRPACSVGGATCASVFAPCEIGRAHV